jgi:hypothetical protein
MRPVKRAAVVAVAALALLAAGCGGGDDDEGSGNVTPAAEWAAGLCSAISTWTEAVQAAGEPLGKRSSLSRATIEQAGREMRAASDAFEQELDALGAPEVQAGDEAKSAIDDFRTTLDEELAEIDETVEGVSGGTDFPDAVNAIVASLTSLRQAFNSMLAEIRTSGSGEELQEFFDAARSCKPGGSA